MAVDYSRLKSLTARPVVNALIRDGFVLDLRTGAHRHYLHPDGRRVPSRLTTKVRPSPKTLKAMIELQARWSEADLRRLKLTK
jgi:predicted RNA binding protein YcfA (HicA-like mRNA interferase family)